MKLKYIKIQKNNVYTLINVLKRYSRYDILEYVKRIYLENLKEYKLNNITDNNKAISDGQSVCIYFFIMQ